MRDLFRFLFRQRNNLLFLALMVISMSLLINGNMHQRAQAISSSNAVIGQIYTWRHDLTEFTDLRAVNQQLAQALAEERTRNHSPATPSDSVILHVDSAREEAYRFITAQVINSTAHKERNYLTLDRGTLDGVHPDLGVVGMNGIVGIVRDASPHFALVTSILGNEIEPAVVLSRTGHYGLLKWDTGDPATASMVDVAKYVPVHVGDPVVTRGGDHVFPAGLPVGTVIAVHDDPGSNFHGITFKLAEDVTRSGYVHIVFDLLGNERDSLEAKTALP
jgi:rod shape-determining protein MreC